MGENELITLKIDGIEVVKVEQKPKIVITDFDKVMKKAQKQLRTDVTKLVKKLNKIDEMLFEGVTEESELEEKREELKEETNKEIKKIIAKWNKEFTNADSVRKEIKNYLLDFLSEFTGQLDEFEGLIEKETKIVKKVLEEFELAQKEKKNKEIRDYYKDLFSTNKDVQFSKIEDIWDARWLNKTFVMSKIKNEIKYHFEKLSNEIKLINMDSNGARIKTVYTKNGYKLAEAKETVLSAIALERQEQARIDATIEAKGMAVEENVVENIKKDVKSSISNTSGVKPVANKTLRFSLSGSTEDLTDIVKYIKSKNNVELKQI